MTRQQIDIWIQTIIEDYPSATINEIIKAFDYMNKQKSNRMNLDYAVFCEGISKVLLNRGTRCITE